MDSLLPVYVLVGGQSERFGIDKATHEVDGLPWAWHVGSRLATDASACVLVGKTPPVGLPGVRFVPDVPSVEGPLAGVLAALDDRLNRWGPGRFALASCDLVRPEAHWLDPLMAALDADADLEVAAYRIAGLWQPFPLIAHTRWRDRLANHLQAGRRSFQAVLNGEAVGAAPWQGTPAAGPPQANTLAELDALLKD